MRDRAPTKSDVKNTWGVSVGNSHARAPPMAFDVASVKPSLPASRVNPSLHIAPDSLVVTNYPLGLEQPCVRRDSKTGRAFARVGSMSLGMSLNEDFVSALPIHRNRHEDDGQGMHRHRRRE